MTVDEIEQASRLAHSFNVKPEPDSRGLRAVWLLARYVVHLESLPQRKTTWWERIKNFMGA